MTHVRRVVDSRTAIVPVDTSSLRRDKLLLHGQIMPALQARGPRTLVLVSELYTFKTGSSVVLTGLTHSGMFDPDALGASTGVDIVKNLFGA